MRVTWTDAALSDLSGARDFIADDFDQTDPETLAPFNDSHLTDFA
jgi:plasmid stabilization system protein ParE